MDRSISQLARHYHGRVLFMGLFLSRVFVIGPLGFASAS